MKSGVLLIDKPAGMTSRDVVNQVGKMLGTRKVGHTGTLDPLATGVLILGVNQGTKVIDLLTQTEKEYLAEVQMGFLTDTLDVTGHIIEENDKFVTEEQISSVMTKFLGKQLQQVPLYSAVRVNGKRLYEYARSGEDVTLPIREIEVKKIELINFREKDHTFSFRVSVSKGTYIRSLIRDIGQELGVLCTMKNLTRTKQGIFTLEETIPLNQVSDSALKPITSILSEFETFTVTEFEEKKIKNGMVLNRSFSGDYGMFLSQEGHLLAIYQVYKEDETKMKPYQIFHEEDV